MITGKGLKIFFLFGFFFWVRLAGSVSAAELAPLRASYSAVSGIFTPVWLAQDKGFFANYGLTVDLRFVAPSAATQSLLAKSLDIVMGGGEFIEASLAGARMVYIAGVANRVVLSLYAKPEIHALSDLRGRVLAALSPGSTSDFLARILLQEGGLVPGKDVKIIYLKSGPEILAALTQGIIDAGIVSAPMTLKARKAGFREAVNAGEKNIPMIHAAVATTGDFVKEHPDRARAFLRGYIEGIKVAQSNAEEAMAVIGKYTKTTDREDLEETYRTFAKVWEKVPYVSAGAVQTNLNFAKSPAAKTAKPETFIDNSILAELERSGFIKQLYP
ncbi:MAG: ABC transporter substrate-binding protein [Deltaproteobacteria bacterium]|nr:ABC transporter substrate-binding protein [Deltaproteobacteria bacterium]